jgi:hypothetical protein
MAEETNEETNKETKAPRGRLKRWLALGFGAFVLIFGLIAIFATAELPQAGEPGAEIAGQTQWFLPVNTNEAGVAIGGYDPVSYFQEGGPEMGDEKVTTEWQDATWWFKSDEHRAQFVASPEKYSPQFGGNCVFGASVGSLVPGSPTNWSLVGGRLFLSSNAVANVLWRAVPNSTADAYAKWEATAKTKSIEN